MNFGLIDLNDNRFFGIPRTGGATCKTRAKIKGLAQNFGLNDLNDDRLLCLMLFIIFHSSDYHRLVEYDNNSFRRSGEIYGIK